ncbi:bifunctional hydroxymethylpyrimidine kinase/phosphomethylpyrimidine kinase [Ornithinimicrobium panacihumi]|uniref:bifunctional hydroxymethylpyrimidine kinase/phosphomethylpyrimidine kinase n=1 Tax=Ornithinimicrobium panacihumi TaxID=2008449 RepID=UPI003F89F858
MPGTPSLPPPDRLPVVATLAGSDPSGGAGIQADLKTFSALGAYGCAVITSLTAQSTMGVTGVHAVPPAFVREQVETLVADVTLDAVKIGMLGTAEMAGMVGELIAEGLLPRVVLDPVMVSTAGSRLLDEDAVEAVRALLPHVDLITPNLPEAAVLLGRDLPEASGAQRGETAYPLSVGVADQRDLAQELVALGARRVLLKGGHAGGPEAVDVYVDSVTGDVLELTAPRVATRNTHGTGCTLSSAITALLPHRATWPEAVADAKTWLTGALQHADRLSVGSGPGPVHHFYDLWRDHA